MEGAARDGRVVMARDGRRLERPRRLDGAARRRSASNGDGRASSSPARRSTSAPTTSSSAGRRAARGRSPRLERGSMTRRRSPSRSLRGAAPDDRTRRRAASTACAEPGGLRDDHRRGSRRPTTIVFGTDGWRARIADDYTFENVRRCADGVAALRRRARRAGEGRRRSPTTGASPPSTSPRPRPRCSLAHDIPVALAAHAVPTQMSSYEVVERGAAAGIVITASHNPWTDNGFKVKSPTGLGGRPGHAQAHRGAHRRERRRAPSSAGRSPTPRRPAWSSASTRTPGYEQYLRRTIDLDALKAADMHVLVEPMWGAGAGWIPRLLAGGTDPGHRDPPGAQPVLRRRQPRADPAEHRRGARASSPAAATTWACCSTATPTGPARPTSRARSSTSSRSPACSCTTSPSTAACASRSS